VKGGFEMEKRAGGDDARDDHCVGADAVLERRQLLQHHLHPVVRETGA
jgi:hypothetical protein